MSQDEMHAYVRAKQGVETIRKRGAKRKRDVASSIKKLRESLDEHVPSNVKYLVADVIDEDGRVELVAFRKVQMSQRRITSEAVYNAWDAIPKESLCSTSGMCESIVDVALGLLEDELKQRLGVVKEFIEVVPKGSKQDPPEMDSVHIDAVSPEVRDLIVRLWCAKKEAKKATTQDSKDCQPFKKEISRLDIILKEALGKIHGASSNPIDEGAKLVHVRRKKQWVKPKIDFRGEIGPILEEALTGADEGLIPESSELVGVEVIDRVAEAWRVYLDDA